MHTHVHARRVVHAHTHATTRVRSAHRPAVGHGGDTPTKNGHTACTGHAHGFTHRLRPSAYPAIGAPPCFEVGPAPHCSRLSRKPVQRQRVQRLRAPAAPAKAAAPRCCGLPGVCVERRVRGSRHWSLGAAIERKLPHVAPVGTSSCDCSPVSARRALQEGGMALAR